MKKISIFNFSKEIEKKSYLDDELEIVQWRAIILETTLKDVKSIVNENDIIDYDGRGPKDYSDFLTLLEKLVKKSINELLFKTIGVEELLKIQVNDESKYNALQETSRQSVENNSLQILVLRRIDKPIPECFGIKYLRIAIPTEPDNDVSQLVPQYRGKNIKADTKGYNVFDFNLGFFENNAFNELVKDLLE